DTGPVALAGMMFMVGLGLGLVMNLVMVLVQNVVPFKHLGVGTAAVSLFRYLGGAIGTAVLGAILVLSQKDGLLLYEQRFGGASPMAMASALVYGMDRAFLFAVPLAVLAFGLSFLVKEIPLRTTVGAPNAMAAEARVRPLTEELV